MASAKKKAPAKKTDTSKPKQKIVPPTGATPLPDRKYRDNATFYQGNPYDDKKSKLFMNAPNKNRKNGVPGGTKFIGYN